MSRLRAADKTYLELILAMGGGYVLDFTDRTFAELFDRYEVTIDSEKYEYNGTSKAKRLRAFWEIEPDLLVGRVLSEMVEV